MNKTIVSLESRLTFFYSFIHPLDLSIAFVITNDDNDNDVVRNFYQCIVIGI